jgi:hypothetical protein
MDTRAVRGEEPVEKAVHAHGFQDLDATPARIGPACPPEGAGGLDPFRHPSQHRHQDGRSVGDTRQGDRDMIEQD